MSIVYHLGGRAAAILLYALCMANVLIGAVEPSKYTYPPYVQVLLQHPNLDSMSCRQSHPPKLPIAA